MLFRRKLGEDQKKKKVFAEIRGAFSPESGEDQKKKKKVFTII